MKNIQNREIYKKKYLKKNTTFNFNVIKILKQMKKIYLYKGKNR